MVTAAPTTRCYTQNHRTLLSQLDCHVWLLSELQVLANHIHPVFVHQAAGCPRGILEVDAKLPHHSFPSSTYISHSVSIHYTLPHSLPHLQVLPKIRKALPAPEQSTS